jgi:TonB family protein
MPFRWVAIAAAILLHVAVPLSLLVNWEGSTPVPPPSIPVTLILTPPPPPPPPPETKRASAAKALPAAKYRESGPDLQTAGPPPAPPTPQPEEKPVPPPPPAQQVAPQEPVPAQPTEAAKPAQSAAAEVPPPPPVTPPDAVPIPAAPKAPTPSTKPAEPAQAKDQAPSKDPAPPRPPAKTALARPPSRPPILNREEAPQETSGDRYLNLLMREMDKHRVYPALARPLGLSGIAHFAISIDRGGRLLNVKLEKSSGSALLDQAGERMIRETAPFPAPPSDYPDGFVLAVQVPFSPTE